MFQNYTLMSMETGLLSIALIKMHKKIRRLIIPPKPVAMATFSPETCIGRELQKYQKAKT